MNTITITTIIYTLSVYLNWKYTHIMVSPTKGKYPNSFTGSKLTTEMILTFIPVINTIGVLRWLIDWPYKNTSNNNAAKKFFKIED